MRVTLKGDRGIIHDPPLRVAKLLTSELPKPVMRNDKLSFSNDLRGWRRLAELMPDLELPPEIKIKLIDTSVVRIEDISVDNFPYKTTPYAHQDEALKKTALLSSVALLMEMGTGKSKVVVDTAALLWALGKISVLLIVSPSGVHEKWIYKEIEDHLPDWVPRKAAFSNTTDLMPTLSSLFDDTSYDGLIILSVNAELFAASKQLEHLNSALKGYNVFVAVDESTRFKNTDAKRWDYLREITLNSDYVRILTGSPVTRHVDDLYGQFKLMMENVAGERTLTGFRARYCERDADKYNRVVGSRNIEELAGWLKQHSFIKRKHECLDLPPKTYLPRRVPLSKQQLLHYNELRDDLITYIKDEAIEVEHVMAKIAKLATVCSGFLITPSGHLEELDCRARMDVVREIVDEADAPVVVFCRFKPEVRRLCREFNWAVPYSGDETKEQRSANLKAFQAGHLRALIGTMASGGIGLDMTAANQMIYYSHTFDAEHRWQSEDRIHRIGQLSSSVTYHEIFAPGTVDTKMLANNRKKQQTSDLLFDYATDAITKETFKQLTAIELRHAVTDLLDGVDPTLY